MDFHRTWRIKKNIAHTDNIGMYLFGFCCNNDSEWYEGFSRSIKPSQPPLLLGSRYDLLNIWLNAVVFSAWKQKTKKVLDIYLIHHFQFNSILYWHRNTLHVYKNVLLAIQFLNMLISFDRDNILTYFSACFKFVRSKGSQQEAADPMLTPCWPLVDPLLTPCWPHADPILAALCIRSNVYFHNHRISFRYSNLRTHVSFS